MISFWNIFVSLFHSFWVGSKYHVLRVTSVFPWWCFLIGCWNCDTLVPVSPYLLTTFRIWIRLTWLTYGIFQYKCTPSNNPIRKSRTRTNRRGETKSLSCNHRITTFDIPMHRKRKSNVHCCTLTVTPSSLWLQYSHVLYVFTYSAVTMYCS